MLDEGIERNYFDDGYVDGYVQGLEIGGLETLIRQLRHREKKYQKTDNGDIAKLESSLDFLLPSSEQYEELLSFIRKYPKMNVEKLARLILKETEFRYLL